MEKSLTLPIAILPEEGNTEVIVKYNDDIQQVGTALGASVEILDENYAIITLRSEQIPLLYSFSQVEYIELPKILTPNLLEDMNRACITQVQSNTSHELRGNGTIVGIIDSGIDYTHPDFRSEDNLSRILYIWDQTGTGPPPSGFTQGTEYNRTQIDEALQSAVPFSVIPPMDTVGHGTAVAGIAAGNGRASGGQEQGAAPEASLIVVRLGQQGGRSFARTTEIMRALKYIFDKAQSLDRPLAVNLSFGTNNGAHDGSSLFETYIDDMAQKWKAAIVVASGNEGAVGHHFAGQVRQSETTQTSFVTGGGLQSMYITFWKNFVDTFTLELIAPSGQSSGILRPEEATRSLQMDGIPIAIYYGQPTHYNEDQEVFFQLQSTGIPFPAGVWQLKVYGEQVTDGRFDIWLPTTEEVGADTAFLNPTTDTTLSLPSTARNVITVGGYNALINSAASFSGRGYTRNSVYVKPDLVAPAVNVLAPRIGGGYDRFTGTSMAAPFVTGSAALMMEWGIVQNHDPFLYGQRAKAFLQKGAQRDASRTYPNPVWGYGTLCLKNTMDYLIHYITPAF